MTEQELWEQIKPDIMLRIESIAERIKDRMTLNALRYKPYPIRDTGRFTDSLTYQISEKSNEIHIKFGWDSRVKYGQYIVGGKVPSWTPIQPLIAWVKRKRLNWTDKTTNKPLSVEQMAYMIRNKIKRDGIPERDPLGETIKNDWNWIEQLFQKTFDV